MAIGTTTMTVYQDEDVSWDFTVSDTRVTDISAWVIIELVIKETASELNPPLIGPSHSSPTTGNASVCAVTDTLTFSATFNANLTPGNYIYSVRREDAGYSWQLAQGTLTVVDSASKD